MLVRDLVAVGSPLCSYRTSNLNVDVIAHAAPSCRLSTTISKVFTTIASCIRKAFEKSYGRGWNVAVGRSFGAYVTHEIKTYMYFTVVPGVYVLLWRWVAVRLQ